MVYTHNTNNKTESEFSSMRFKLKKDEGILFYGNLIDQATGKPLENVNVRIVDLAAGKNILNVKTDENGYFAHKVKSDEDSIHYELIIQKEGNLEKSEFLHMKLSDIDKLDLDDYVDLAMEDILLEDMKLEAIYFEFDKWDITEKAALQLDKVVQVMRSNPLLFIELSAYTDCQGASDYNMYLSEQRAASTTEYILSKKINATRLTSKAFGETLPISNCDCDPQSKNRCTIAENKLNRRTEFKLIKK